jgi:hypothetical protein
MLGDILIQTLDGKIYFSEGGKAFEELVFDKPESAAALRATLDGSAGQAVGVRTVVHGQFANDHMLNGGSLWFINDVKQTISGDTDPAGTERPGAA